MIARLRRSLRLLRRSEHGIALPMALMVTVVGMGLAAVPIVASVNSQSGNQHNQGGNEALAAAEAGAEIALKEQGALHLDQGGKQEQLCVSGATPSEGWCPAEPVDPENPDRITEGTVGLARYRYQVRPCYGAAAGDSGCGAVISLAGCNGAEDPVEVVATGTATVAGLPVERRVSVSACASSFVVPAAEREKLETYESEQEFWERELTLLEEPRQPFIARRTKLEGERTDLLETIAREKAEGKTRFTTKTGTKIKEVKREVPAAVFGGGQIVGIEGLTMNNGANVYGGGAGSNKAVSLTGNAQICGSVRYGTTFTATNGSNTVDKGSCPGGRTVVQSPEDKYPPVQLPADIAKSNSNVRLGGADPASGYNRGNISWNESKKELVVTYGELKVEGVLPYYLCKLTLAGGSKLVPGSGKSIRFFFPEPTETNCPGLNGSATQLVIGNGAEVLADSNHGPGFYFAGSSKKGGSNVELGGGANVSQFIVYAPRSTVTANNGVNLMGSIIGETLDIQGGAKINKTAYTPPSTTEFTAPEVVVEKTEEPTSEEVLSELGKNEDELVHIETEIQKLTEEIEAINADPIKVVKNELTAVIIKVTGQIKTIQTLEGSEGSSTFEKSGFDECGAPPHHASDPAAGCA